MSPASGEFFAPGRPDHKFGLETLGCETGRIRRQVRPTQRRARRLVEKETADATGDRTDLERTVEHSAGRGLPEMPSMKASPYALVEEFCDCRRILRRIDSGCYKYPE